MNTWQSLLLLLILAVATGWFLQDHETGNLDSASRKQGPDMFAVQIEVIGMDASGHPAYYIKADNLQHSTDTELFYLTRPVIELTRADGDNWHITSDSGQMTDNGDELLFLGEVNIHHQGDQPVHIQTRDLLVKPDEELAETENEVSISTAQYKIDAVGLKADFSRNLLEFRSRVRGIINAAS